MSVQYSSEMSKVVNEFTISEKDFENAFTLGDASVRLTKRLEEGSLAKAIRRKLKVRKIIPVLLTQFSSNQCISEPTCDDHSIVVIECKNREKQFSSGEFLSFLAWLTESNT